MTEMAVRTWTTCSRRENTEDDDQHLGPHGSAANRFGVMGSARVVASVGVPRRLSHARLPPEERPARSVAGARAP